MSLNKEAEALETATPAPSQPPPTYSSPPSGGAPIQPTFTGNAQPQLAQNMQFSPTTPMAQLPSMQNQFVGSNHPSMTRASTAPVFGTQQAPIGANPALQPGMGVPLQPGLGSPQFAQQTVNVNGFAQQAGTGFTPNAVPQGVPVGQFGQAVNPNMGQQAAYVPYPVLVQPQPPAGPTAAQIGEQFMAQRFAQCGMGNHERRSRASVLGIILAILFFPFGLIFLFVIREETCGRCGQRLN